MPKIEVEKRFRPTEEQLKSMLADSDFVSKETVRNTYYDYPDFAFFKKNIRLRNRNGKFELKVKLSSWAGLELETEEERRRIFNKVQEDKILEVIKSKVNVDIKEVSQEEFNKLLEK